MNPACISYLYKILFGEAINLFIQKKDLGSDLS